MGLAFWRPCLCSKIRLESVWTGNGVQLWEQGLGLEAGWVLVPLFGVQLYSGQPRISPCLLFSVMSHSVSGLK